MTYAFSFDARYCSGCKACQAACKDKNDLPTGVLWRRVFEVTGGGWRKEGEAWTNDVFAYNLSMSCNHCIHPKCAGVCPTKAYAVRDDGVVLLDSSKCVGCGYCAWACPYAVPQYNTKAGYMSKCNFCIDNLEQGLPPACVAACPLRVLEYGEMDDRKEGVRLWDTSPELHPYPLPAFSHTQPRMAISPHPGMERRETKIIANVEEVHPRRSSNWDEFPLMSFTLLSQLAVGGFWIMALASLFLPFNLPASLFIGICMGMGMLASFAHLGTKKNAWRVLSNLSKSSLSKEILFAGLFGLGWLVSLISRSFESMVFTCILGIGLIYHMSQVYRFRAAPGWNTWRTNASFMVSALLLGLSVVGVFAGYTSNITGAQIPGSLWQIRDAAIFILLVIQWLMIRKEDSPRLTNIRIGLIGVAMMLSAVMAFTSQPVAFGAGILVALIVLSEEVLGRWIFYGSRLGTQGKYIHV